METLIKVVHVIVCVFMIISILLQAGKGGGMGAAFGGASSTMFGGRGPATFLSKLTSIFAIVFMLTSIVLAKYATKRDSVVAKGKALPSIFRHLKKKDREKLMKKKGVGATTAKEAKTKSKAATAKAVKTAKTAAPAATTTEAVKKVKTPAAAATKAEAIRKVKTPTPNAEVSKKVTKVEGGLKPGLKKVTSMPTTGDKPTPVAPPTKTGVKPAPKVGKIPVETKARPSEKAPVKSPR